MIDGSCFFQSIFTGIMIDKIQLTTIRQAAAIRDCVKACEKSSLFSGAGGGNRTRTPLGTGF
jgi:hypothetical protein